MKKLLLLITFMLFYVPTVSASSHDSHAQPSHSSHNSNSHGNSTHHVLSGKSSHKTSHSTKNKRYDTSTPYDGNSEKITLFDYLIIDGDTIYSNNHGQKLRLWGIDSPEMAQTCTDKATGEEINCGQLARKELQKLTQHTKLECRVKYKDKYKRLVAECFNLNGYSINALMVKLGWAVAYDRYSLKFIPDQDVAKENHAGIWAMNFLKPEYWRIKNSKRKKRYR